MIRWLLRWPAQVGLTLVLVSTAVLASIAMFFTYRDAAREEALRGTEAVLEQIVHTQARRIVAIAARKLQADWQGGRTFRQGERGAALAEQVGGTGVVGVAAVPRGHLLD